MPLSYFMKFTVVTQNYSTLCPDEKVAAIFLPITLINVD